MKANMHAADKAIRVVFALIVAVLYLSGNVTGTLAIVLSIIAIVLIATVFINFCPLYHLLGISTNKKANQSQKK